MKTKRGFTVLMTLLVIVILVGCSEQQSIPVNTPQSASPSAFVSSLPSVRDSVTNSFSSADIYLSDVLTNLGGSRLMNSPPATIASSVKEKARAFEETLSGIDLIMSDFNSNRAGIDSSRLSSSDSDLLQTIEGKLTRYSSSKDKMLGCFNSLNKYSEFVDLTMQREDAIKAFTSKLQQAGDLVGSNKFDQAISLGQQARGDLLKIKNADVARNAMGIVNLGEDTMKAWDVHLEAMDILISLWNDLKANNMDAATQKAQTHANTFDRANKLGANEPSPEAQANMVDTWLKANVEICKGVLS